MRIEKENSQVIEQQAIEHACKLQQDGYTVLKSQFSPESAGAAIQEYDEYVADLSEHDRLRYRKPDGFMCRLSNFHGLSKAMQQVYVQAELYYRTAFYFFGCRRPAISTSLFFANGTEQPIHRDSPAFYTIPEGEFLGVWFALEDANEENGALKVVRRGHRFSGSEYKVRQEIFNVHGDVGRDALWGKYQAHVHPEITQRNLSATTVPVDVGDIIMWHPHLPHGGGAIRDKSKSRYSCVFHVAPEGTEIYGRDEFWHPQGGATSRKPVYCQILDTHKVMRQVGPAFQG